MAKLSNYLHNTRNRLRQALRYHDFTLQMLRIHAGERWSELTSPTWRHGEPRLPTDIVIRVTQRCFLRCKFCAQNGEHGRVDRGRTRRDGIARETLQKIIDETSAWPRKPLIKLTGGEPLLLGDELLDAIREMRRRGFVVILSTNGMLLRSETIARRVVETGLSCLSISVDGRREVHNALRGHPKLFDAVMAGIDNVRRFREELGTRLPMIPISLTLSSETQHEIESAYRIAVARQVDWFRVNLLNYMTPETCAEARAYAREHLGVQDAPWEAFCNPRFRGIDPNVVARQIEAIESMRAAVPIYVLGGLSSRSRLAAYYHTTQPLRRHICSLPLTSMHIQTPGTAVFCIDVPFYEYGDVRAQSLESIWFGEKARRFRADLIAHHAEHGQCYPQCRRCNWMFESTP